MHRSVELGYDPVTGNLNSVSGPDGAVVTYSYDVNGDLVAVDKPENARVEYAYSRHRLTEVRVRRGDDPVTATMETVLTNTLDAVNRVIAQTDNEGRTMSVAYQTRPTG